MQSFTVTQWAIVALVFVAGWLLGLASHPGGRKWRDRYAAEREANAAARRDADTRVATAEAKHRELERDHARLAAAAPVTAPTVAPMSPASPIVLRPSGSRYTRPTDAAGERRGWFDWGTRR